MSMIDPWVFIQRGGKLIDGQFDRRITDRVYPGLPACSIQLTNDSCEFIRLNAQGSPIL